MLKRALLVLAATTVVAACGASSAQATLTDFGSGAWFTDGGNHITGTEPIYGGGTVTTTWNNGLNTTCGWEVTGSVENGVAMGEGSFTGVAFTNCTTNAPGCTANWSPNGLAWPLTLSSDGTESFLSFGGFSYTNTYTGVACVLGNGTQVTFSADHLDLTIPEGEESGAECPVVAGHPTGGGGNTGFTVNFAGSGTANGPGGLTSTFSGSMVLCGDDVADLGVTD